jgi:hypothetical protein
MKWLCGLSYVVLTFLGALNMKRVVGFLFGILATLWMAAPAAAWNLNDSEEPGSVLVFHKFEAGTVDSINEGTIPRIEYRVSVVCSASFDCLHLPPTLTPNVTIKAHWVCKGNADNVCKESNFEVQTTPNGTIVFDPQNTLFNNSVTGAIQVTPAPCQEGYLIMWIESGIGGQPIKADALIGTAVQHEIDDDDTLTFSTDARAFNAIPIQANPSLSTGDVIPLNSDGSLPFDGNGYQEITGNVYGNIRYDSPSVGVSTSLTFLTLDVNSNGTNTPTSVLLQFYNEAEVPRSAPVFTFTCWEDQDLFSFNIQLDDSFGRDGLVGSLPGVPGATQNGNPVTLVAFAETEEKYTPGFSVTATGTSALNFGVNALCATNAPATCLTSLPSSCTVTPSTNPMTLFLASVHCDVPFSKGVVATPTLQRSYTYPLLNDSVPVPTAFLPH